MSKPLATKGSTPLSENVQIGPKVSIYCVATIIFQHCLNPLSGMEFTRASQVATGVHSSMTTSRSWWMFETVCSSTFRLRMPHRCSIGFRSGDMLGQSITCTLSLFSKAVVIIMLEYCPSAQSLKGGDHALLQYVTVHVGSTHTTPDHDTPTSMLDCRQDKLVFVLLTWLLPHMLDTRGVRYDDFWSWMIKMSPQSAFEKILYYRDTARTLSVTVMAPPSLYSVQR